MKIILILIAIVCTAFIAYKAYDALTKRQHIRDICYNKTLAASGAWSDQSLIQSFKPYKDCIKNTK